MKYSIFDKIRYCAIPVVYSEFPFFKIKQRFLSESENMADEKSAGRKKTQGFSFLEKRFEQENFMHAFNTTYPRQKQTGGAGGHGAERPGRRAGRAAQVSGESLPWPAVTGSAQ